MSYLPPPEVKWFWLHDAAVVQTYSAGSPDTQYEDDTGPAIQLHDEWPVGGIYVPWGYTGYVKNSGLRIVFPAPVFVSHIYEFSDTDSVYNAGYYFQTSPDTSDGWDGTWTERAYYGTNSFGEQYVGYPTFRSPTALRSIGLNLRGMRWLTDGAVTRGHPTMRMLHIYGYRVDQNYDHLSIWDPTLDQRLLPSQGTKDVNRGEGFTLTFRVKNHSTRTAATPTVQIGDESNTGGSIAGSMQVSLNGTTWTSSVALPNIAPGGISGLVTARLLALPVGQGYGPACPYVVAQPAGWS